MQSTHASAAQLLYQLRLQVHDLKHVGLEVEVLRVDRDLVTCVLSSMVLEEVDAACVVTLLIEGSNMDPAYGAKLPRAFRCHRETLCQGLGVANASRVDLGLFAVTFRIVHLD